jgi:uncharacterized protein (DUF927 family)
MPADCGRPSPGESPCYQAANLAWRTIWRARARKAHAGQSVRFVELPADAGAGLGMWNELHHLADGGSFTNHIKTAAARYYGTAGRAFVSALAANLGEAPGTVRKLEARFFAEFVPSDAGGQVKRVAGAFALVAAAGELAANGRFAPGPSGPPSMRPALIFGEWLKARPTAGNLEDAQILAHVRGVMERNWASRFVDWHRATEANADLSRMAAVPDALGFRKRASDWTEDKRRLSVLHHPRALRGGIRSQGRFQA